MPSPPAFLAFYSAFPGVPLGLSSQQGGRRAPGLVSTHVPRVQHTGSGWSQQRGEAHGSCSLLVCSALGETLKSSLQETAEEAASQQPACGLRLSFV